jgi:triosephosphate isomerase
LKTRTRNKRKEIEMQIRNALFGISKSLIKRIVVAYEPVWAIGVDAVRDATPEEAHEIYILIKKTIADIIGSKEANAIRIIFGGSVNEENAYTYIKESHMNGLLIGRASLDQKKFIKIIENISYVG